ncbi:SDP1 [Symbiodinium necroappetens]|uniref:SDP1 protein n=1 Tax=Symbiodinium necroappetens TaxID=1628268 RepID=A0A812K5F0_9DINO|nr:SDP1 [Symbiodinium necroappetens]
MLGVRTDAMWDDTFSWSQNFSLDFFGDLDVSRFLKTGQELYSSEHLGRILRDNMGDLTFLEAFDRTGRIINITVSGLPGNTRYPMLLNYLTSPHVLVWNLSAFQGFCAFTQGLRSKILDHTGCLDHWAFSFTGEQTVEVSLVAWPAVVFGYGAGKTRGTARRSTDQSVLLQVRMGGRLERGRALNLLHRLGKVSQSLTEDELRAAIDVLADPLEGLLRDAAEVDARTLSRLTVSIARVHLRLPSARLQRLAEHSIQLLTRMKTANPQDIANAAWALGRLQFSTSSATLATELLAKVSAEFGAVDLAQSLWSCAALKLHSRLAQPLLAAAAGKCSELSVAGLSSVIWSAATLAMADVWACQRLGNRAQELADRCRARELSNLTWSFATLRMLTRPLAISLASPAAAGAEKFKCQELANIAWAFASASVLTRRELVQTFRRLMASAQTQASQFKPQELCNFSWALVAAEAPCTEWLAAAAAIFESSPARFNSKDLVQLTWCFARASSESTAIAGVANQAVRELRQPLSLQDLADLMWSCAKTQVREKALLQSFTQSFLSDGAAVSRCKPIELSNLAWSIVKLGLHEEQEFFLSELCRYSAEQMADFKPVELANLSYSLARASIRCVDTFAAIARQVEKQLESFTAYDLGYTAWAFATANIARTDLFYKIARKSTSMLGDFTEQGFSDLVWSFAIQSVFSKDLFMAVQTRLHQGLDEQKSSPSTITQHADYLRRLVWAMSFSGILTDPIRAQAQKAFQGFGDELDAERGSSIFACFGRAIRSGIISSCEPGIAWEASGLVVLHKPAGWKVDTEGEQLEKDENCLLSSYQQVFFQGRCHPILLDLQHSKGFLHRLDIPSSGLVTCTLTYKAFWDLQQQLVTGTFAREYVSLCYGWAPVDLQHIGVNIFWNRRVSSLSKVGPQGKTSVTDLKDTNVGNDVFRCKGGGMSFTTLLPAQPPATSVDDLEVCLVCRAVLCGSARHLRVTRALGQRPLRGNRSVRVRRPEVARWIDAVRDLPMARLAELFNVNYFIVSQVNPQAMLLTGGGVGSQKGPIFRVAQFLRREIKQYLQSTLELFRGASGRHPWLRPVGNTLIALVVQDLLGDVTIYNGRGLLEFPKLLKNPTNEVLRTYTKASEWETWWHIPEIQNACAIEFVMDEIVKELLADLRASEEEMSGLVRTPSLCSRMLPQTGLKRPGHTLQHAEQAINMTRIAGVSSAPRVLHVSTFGSRCCSFDMLIWRPAAEASYATSRHILSWSV